MIRTSNCQILKRERELDPMVEVPTARVPLRRTFQTALTNAKKPCLKAGTSLKICRTVEMVDQKTETWRSERSKMLYITALGLTPVDNCKGMVPFSLTTADKFRLEDLKLSCSTSNTHTKTNTSHLDHSNEKSMTNSNATTLDDIVKKDDEDSCIFLCEIKYKTITGYPNKVRIGYKTGAPAKTDDDTLSHLSQCPNVGS